MLLLLSTALANGQTTHVWISRHALTHLPSGELKELLLANETQLVNGSMFPDGGYGFNPQHPYAETAHWEPFQSLYLDWIGLEHPAPFDAEGEKHVAFLMGMASHGMADQSFDALYMERSKVYDADAGWVTGVSMDEATDVWWAHITEPQVVPERWVPYAVFTELFAEVGIEATEDELEDGQKLLGIALDLVGLLSESESARDGYALDYPWATGHLHDAVDVPGAPRCEGELVALYWIEMWARLHGQWGPLPVLETLPNDGGFGLDTDASRVESRISIVFARGLLDVGPEHFVVESEGEVLTVEPWLFYRDDSHIVHLIPEEDWPQDAEITVTVQPGLVDRYGLALGEAYAFTVSTSDPPEPEPKPDERGCSHIPCYSADDGDLLRPLRVYPRAVLGPVAVSGVPVRAAPPGHGLSEVHRAGANGGELEGPRGADRAARRGPEGAGRRRLHRGSPPRR